MAARVDPCPPALRDLRDVLVNALVKRLLRDDRELRHSPTRPNGVIAKAEANADQGDKVRA